MKILVAVDESDCSKAAIEYIAERPWGKDVEFYIFSVVQPIPEDVGLGHFPPAVSTYIEEQKRLSENVVEQAAACLKERLKDNKIQTDVVVGPVVDRIISMAENREADLIILGSHGRKGFAHFFLGSVAEEVVRSAPCSVQVIKIKQEAKTSAERDKKTQPQSV